MPEIRFDDVDALRSTVGDEFGPWALVYKALALYNPLLA